MAISVGTIFSDFGTYITDCTLTRSIDKLVKIVSWYDNEVGISNRLAELTVELAGKVNKLAEA